jgi:hypothetical protein
MVMHQIRLSVIFRELSLVLVNHLQNAIQQYTLRLNARDLWRFCSKYLNSSFTISISDTQMQASQTDTTTVSRTISETVTITNPTGTPPTETTKPSTKTTTKSTPTKPTTTNTNVVTQTVTTTIYTTVYATSTPKPTTTKPTPPTTTEPVDPNRTKCPVPLYYQCGGATWTGCSKCVKDAVCTSQNGKFSPD